MAKTEVHTYDEWNSLGYHIRRGEKATIVDGKLVFTKAQVSKRLSRPIKSYTSRSYTSGLDWDDMDDAGEGGPFY